MATLDESVTLAEQERRLLNRFQQTLPFSERPYADMAAACGLSEQELLERLRQWQADGVISRVGGVLNHQRLGASTLAALAVPDEQLEAVAALVSSYPQVNHNYQREHAYNLWFVVTAPSQGELDEVLAEIAERTDLPLLDLPMVKGYHLNLGFDLL